MRFRNPLIRHIDTDTPPTGGDSQGETPTPPEQVDWEAKYRDAIQHSREWEKRAKANSSAAEELERLKTAQLTDLEKAQARADKAEKALADLKHTSDVNAWKANAAKEAGIPTELLRGDTEADITAHATALKTFLAEANRPKAATVSNASSTPKDATNPNRALLSALFGNK